MLQRVPQILAVTANAYGLSLETRDTRKPSTAVCHHRHRHAAASEGKSMARR